jgi:hypothetical protein
VLRHRLLKPALDVPVPSADITAISKAVSRNSDIERAVGTAWFLFLISMAVVLLTIFELNGTVRIVATILFAITAPGWTVTAFLLPLEPAMEWSLAVALSLSISIALSMFMLLTGWWTPVGMMLGLACVVAGLQILHISVLSQGRRFWLDDAHSGENVEVTLGWTPVTAEVALFGTLSMALSRLRYWLRFGTRSISLSRLKYGLRSGTQSMSRSRLKYGLRFWTRSIAQSGPILQQPNLSQEEIPTRRIPRATQQLSTQEMAGPGAVSPGAVHEEKLDRAAADAEKEDRKKELAEDERDSAQDYRMRVEKAQLPDKVRKAALREVGKLERTSDQSPESGATRSWLDTVLDLPWSTMTTDSIDIQGEREVDPAAADRKKVDTEKVDPAASDRKMVDGEKVDPARTGEIAWPVPPWAADTEMVDGAKVDPAAAEVEKAEAARVGPDNDETVEMPPVAVFPLRAMLVSRPSHGTLSRNADGSFIYSPEDNFNGSDSFTYRVSDGNLASDSATVTLTLTAHNHTPTVRVAAGRTYSRDDYSVTVNLTAPDMETPAADLALNAGSSNPALVSTSNVNFAASGAALTMTVSAVDGRSGTAILTLTVTDRQACDSVQVTVKVGDMGKDTLTGGAGEDSLGGGSDNDRLTEQVGRAPSQRRQRHRSGKRHHRRRGRHH